MDTILVNTKTVAELLGGYKPASIRRSLCVKGHFLGLRPVKLQNGRLLWNIKEVEELVNSKL